MPNCQQSSCHSVRAGGSSALAQYCDDPPSIRNDDRIRSVRASAGNMLANPDAGSGGTAELPPLLEKVAQADQHALTCFYNATVSHVYGLALRITRCRESAEEVVCDVYLQVWRQAERYDPKRGGVLPWLMVLCRSRAVDAWRRENAHIDRVAEIDECGSDDEQPEDLLLAVEENTAVHSALWTLSDMQRQLIGLAYFRGFSHSEMARFTGLPIGTVKSLVRRSLFALRSQLHGIAH